jgi:2-polyprenyl-3-methyl-5-hydroxy-6-metoxy-1,4-benzoquinol methylase
MPVLRERLRASPNFALALTMDGRAYIAKEVEPYIQYWLSERERLLFALFAKKGGCFVDDAIADCLKLNTKTTPARLAKIIANMKAADVLIGVRDDTSRYDAHMAETYRAYRPFPKELTAYIVQAALIDGNSQILDLAGGPGSLALELAKTSDHVSMMELSTGFIAAARKAAKANGVPLTAIHDSCNRLVFHDEDYDVVTVSQALHWLDDVMVCKGVRHILRKNGSFFVIQSGFSLPDSHPLSYILGDRTPLGDKPALSFARQAEALLRRLSLLFEALDTADVERIDHVQKRHVGSAHIEHVAATLFSQQRPIGLGFARAFLTPTHITPTGQTPAQFWRELEARCANAKAEDLMATQDWAILQFKRGGTPLTSRAVDQASTISIGWDGPPLG